jgi:5'-3' exonuclease
MSERVTLLLDSDIIAYKFAAAAQKNFDWDGDGDFVSVVQELGDVVPKVREYIGELVMKLGADEVIVCLSCPSSENFRYKVLPSYKHNRKDTQKPELLSAIKEWMRESFPVYERPTLEADDIMGILSTHPTLVAGKKIIVSEDKDMRGIPGWLFNPEKDDKPRCISEEEADYFHLYQTLIGDPTDGYSGCPGIGPVKAENILRCPDGSLLGRWSAWQAVVAAYESAKIKKTREPMGLTEEDALVQARVARICRFTDYNFKTKEVILWNPPTN